MVELTRLEYVAGDTWYIAIDIDGLYDSLSTAYFTLKSSLDDDTPILQASLGDGITQDEDDPKVYIVRVDQADTGIEAGDYFYDIHIGGDGDEYTPLIGRVKVIKGVTR